MSTPADGINLLDDLDQALAEVPQRRRHSYDGALVGILAGILAQTATGREAWAEALRMLTILVKGRVR